MVNSSTGSQSPSWTFWFGGPHVSAAERTQNATLFVRCLLFLFVLLVAVISQVTESLFLSERSAMTFYSVSGAGLILQMYHLLQSHYSNQKIFISAVLNSFLICILFWGLQTNQSLFLLLLLVNILLAGLQSGVGSATDLALITSVFYSATLILSSSVSQLQDLLSVGLFNVSSFVVAALAGQLSEQLTQTQTAFAKSQDLFLDLSSRHRILIEELPMGLLVINKKGEVIESNEIYEREFKGFISAQSISDLKGPVETNQMFQLERSFKLAEKSEVNLQDGSSVPFVRRDIVFRIRPILSGSETYTLVLLDDVTETRRMEADLKQKEKMAAVGTLAAGIAHEIRNPLAGMSGSIELLSVKPNTEEDQKLFKIILREIDRLNKLVGEFLDYSKPEKPPEDKVLVSTVIEDVLKFLEESPQKPTNLNLVKVMESAPEILGQSDKLRQAFLNIIINSFQAMAQTNQPTLKVGLKHEKETRRLIVTIQDNGSGMSLETKRKMFEPFHTTKPKGTGLGLAITHKILDVHKAQVFVESEVGQGTSFKLIFPCA